MKDCLSRLGIMDIVFELIKNTYMNKRWRLLECTQINQIIISLKRFGSENVRIKIDLFASNLILVMCNNYISRIPLRK